MIFNHEEHEEHEDIQSPKSVTIKKISNRTGALEFDETDPFEQDSDHDGLADGKEDANRNDARHPGEPDPLEDDGVNEGLERKTGTAPLYKDSLPALRIPWPSGEPDAQDASAFRTVSSRNSAACPANT